MKKEGYPALVAIGVILINCIIVYFGRIHYPKNFVTDGLGKPVAFFENLWVLTLGECFVGCLIALVVIGIWYIVSEIVEEVRDLFNI